MLRRFEQVEPECVLTELPSRPQPEELNALAANLPPRLDIYLKKLIDSSMKRNRKSDFDIKRMLVTFSSGRGTDAAFQTTLEMLDTTRSGPTCKARLCAWMLGISSLKPDQRYAAVVRLRSLLRSTPGFLLMPGESRMMRAAMWTVPFSIPLALLATIPFWSQPGGIGIPVAIALTVLFSGCLFLPSLFVAHETERQAARQLRFITAHALGRLQAVEALDALVAASLEQDAYLSEIALISLRVVLPHLSADHHSLLGTEAIPNLCRLLKRYAPAFVNYNDAGQTLTTELLGALEKVGDSRAIPHVLQLASDWPPGPLKEKAAQVLTLLEERKRRETERGTLLRGATPPVGDPTELLRAATSLTESQSEQLLRPMD